MATPVTPVADGAAVSLQDHEARSQSRYEHIIDKLCKGEDMSNIDDKVNIHVGGSGSGDGGMAAIIAALGNRNEGGGMAALAPLLAAQGNNGMNNLWPIVLLALLGRGRGGLLGGDEGCVTGGISAGQAAFDQTILNGINGLTSAVPTTALETQNAIQGAIASLALGTQQGFANAGDKITNAATVNLQATNTVGSTLLQAGSANTQTILNAIAGVSTKIDANEISNLQRALTVAESRAAEDRHAARVREVEVNVSQNVNQQQQQAQFQNQISAVLASLGGLTGSFNQIARSTQDMINIGGVMAGSSQTANPVNVR